MLTPRMRKKIKKAEKLLRELVEDSDAFGALEYDPDGPIPYGLMSNEYEAMNDIRQAHSLIWVINDELEPYRRQFEQERIQRTARMLAQ